MKKITFNKKSLITILMLLLIQTGWSQDTRCIVYDDLTTSQRTELGISEQSFQAYLDRKRIPKNTTTTYSVPQNYTITPKKFRLKFWSVQYQNPPTVDQLSAKKLTAEQAIRQVKILNEYYKDHSICFELGGIGELKTDSLGTKYFVNMGNLQEEARLKNSYDENAINIFIYNNTNAWGAATPGDNFLVIKEFPMSYNPYNTLAHELGHTFGLIHTHGDGNRDNINFTCYNYDFPTNCEHVTRDPNNPNYNALTHGDKVHDTAADPGLFPLQSGDHAHCYNQDANCNYIGNQNDCIGTPYMIDDSVLRNIMSYGKEDCATNFTIGQRERMHYLIDNGDHSHPNYTLDYAPIRTAMVHPNNLSDFDLMVRNTTNDLGFEPDNISVTLWDSPDIWIRNNNDNNTEHQNPYNSGLNYVKVRITNKGCSEFTQDGVTKLKLYWSKAGTNLPKTIWEGGIFTPTGFPMGGLIGEVDISNINSYEEMIFTFPWNAPYSGDYTNVNEPWHFCLLAKIESPYDVSSHPEDDGHGYLFRNSNNIALKNVTLVDKESNSGKIHIGNFESVPRDFKLKVSRDTYHFPETNIFEEAEVKFTFDEKLWNIWQEGGLQGSEFELFEERTIIVNENSEIILKNFPANDFGLLDVKVNFLTSAYTNNIDFGFNVKHCTCETNQLIGGELYLVRKNERDLFEADAVVTNNTLIAIPINEPAVYNWYDTNGNLLHIGQNYTVTNINGTYLLEVIADYDNFKDTKEIIVTVASTSLIHNIYPNPAFNNVTIQYNSLNCNNAYLMLVNINTNAASNYILDVNNTEITINTDPFPAGIYRVVLVCDNNVIESHNLIIQ